MLNCLICIREYQILIGESFMFSSCSERPSLTIPSSYTALSPLHVTSHDRDIHSTHTRRVCTTHLLYEGLAIVLPLAASIAPGMPSSMWRPIINTCSVTSEWIMNDWIVCRPLELPLCRLLNVGIQTLTWWVRISVCSQALQVILMDTDV